MTDERWRSEGSCKLADGQILYADVYGYIWVHGYTGMYMADGQEILRSGGRDALSVGQCACVCALCLM